MHQYNWKQRLRMQPCASLSIANTAILTAKANLMFSVGVYEHKSKHELGLDQDIATTVSCHSQYACLCNMSNVAAQL